MRDAVWFVVSGKRSESKGEERGMVLELARVRISLISAATVLEEVVGVMEAIESGV